MAFHINRTVTSSFSIKFKTSNHKGKVSKFRNVSKFGMKPKQIEGEIDKRNSENQGTCL